MTYEKSFTEETVRLSDEIGVKKASEQMGVPYYTLTDRRQQRKRYSTRAYIGSGSTSRKERTVSFSCQMRSCRRCSVFSPRTERNKSAASVCICGRACQQMAGHGVVPHVEAQRIRLLPLSQAQRQTGSGQTSFGRNTEDTG